jgi:AraC-like DNA-binding protein
MTQSFDLLGDPVDPNHGRRGRPRHVATEENRRRVMVLLAFDWSEEKIAGALGITDKTLRRHYFRELKVKVAARWRVEAKLLSHLMSEVEAGNVSAMDRFFKRLDRHDLTLAGGTRRPARQARVGLKEQRRLAAHTAHEATDWGDDVPRPRAPRPRAN